MIVKTMKEYTPVGVFVNKSADGETIVSLRAGEVKIITPNSVNNPRTLIVKIRAGRAGSTVSWFFRLRY